MLIINLHGDLGALSCLCWPYNTTWEYYILYLNGIDFIFFLANIYVKFNRSDIARLVCCVRNIQTTVIPFVCGMHGCFILYKAPIRERTMCETCNISLLKLKTILVSMYLSRLHAWFEIQLYHWTDIKTSLSCTSTVYGS